MRERVNLLPPEYRRKSVLKPYHIIAIVAALAYIIGLTTIHLRLADRVERDKNVLTLRQSELKEWEQRKGEITKVRRIVKQMQGSRDELKAKKELLNQLVMGKTIAWGAILREFSNICPTKIWFGDLKVSRNGLISIIGYTQNIREISEFMTTIEQSPDFDECRFSDVAIDPKVKAKPSVYAFKITCKYVRETS